MRVSGWLLVLLCWSCGSAVGAAQTVIHINLPAYSLSLMQDGQVAAQYAIAIGRPAMPTPQGSFQVEEKEVQPTWYPPQGGRSVPPGPDNPLGTRWIGFLPMYGIHGTNRPESIGQAISNGCIRMQQSAVEALYDRVTCGDAVEIDYQRLVLAGDEYGAKVVYGYPDVYRCQPLDTTEIEQVLRGWGWAGFADTALVQRLATAQAGGVVLLRQHVLYWRGEVLSEAAIEAGGICWLPFAVGCRLLGELTGQEPQLTENGELRTARVVIPSVVKGGQRYIPLDAFTLLCSIIWRYPEQSIWLEPHL